MQDKLKLISNANEKISYLRAKVINTLINKSLELYKQHFENIVLGNHSEGLVDIIKMESKALYEVQKFSEINIYNHRSVVEIENAGYNVMGELLHHFIPPTLTKKDDRKGWEKKALQLLPEQFYYENGTDYQKILGVLDFVSGMTDNFATDLYRKIKGIEIGMTM